MSFWAYMLRCSDGRYYTGHTDDLEHRFAQHQAGGYCAYTSRRRPVELVWAQDFPSREEALAVEMQVGGWSRAKKQALIARDWERLSYFALPPRERQQRRHERFSTSLETNGGERDSAYSASSSPAP